jgi:hypothetical protein
MSGKLTLALLAQVPDMFWAGFYGGPPRRQTDKL